MNVWHESGCRITRSIGSRTPVIQPRKTFQYPRICGSGLIRKKSETLFPFCHWDDGHDKLCVMCSARIFGKEGSLASLSTGLNMLKALRSGIKYKLYNNIVGR